MVTTTGGTFSYTSAIFGGWSLSRICRMLAVMTQMPLFHWRPEQPIPDRVSVGACRLFPVLAALARKDGFCFPGYSWLAKHFKVSRRTIGVWIRELAALGAIAIERRYHTSTLYRILLPLGKLISDRKVRSTLPVYRKNPSDKRHPSGESKIIRRTIPKAAASGNSKSADLPEVSAAFGRKLSAGDVAEVEQLETSGVPRAAIVAGIVVGRARKLVSDTNRGVREFIYSLRYFRQPIAQAAGGAFPPGYVEYLRRRLKRLEAAV